jgi:hypothetical protein
MGSLGSFGTVHEVPADQGEAQTFDYFGTEIKLERDFNQIQLVDLMETARTVDETDPTAMVIVKDTLRVLIDQEEFNTFWNLAKRNRQTLEDLARLMQVLMEAQTERPTQQPSDSSAGRQPIDVSSLGALPRQGSRGRPDLQLLVDQGQETKARIAAAAAAVG